MQVNTGTHVPQHLRGDQRTTTCLCFLPCLRHGLFSVPWSLKSGYLVGELLGSLLFVSFHLAIVALGLQMGVTVMTSMWILAILTQVLPLVWQELCPLSIFPAPKHHFKGLCPSLAKASGLVCGYSTPSSLVPWGCCDCPTCFTACCHFFDWGSSERPVRSILLYFACLSISVELRTLLKLQYTTAQAALQGCVLPRVTVMKGQREALTSWPHPISPYIFLYLNNILIFLKKFIYSLTHPNCSFSSLHSSQFYIQPPVFPRSTTQKRAGLPGTSTEHGTTGYNKTTFHFFLWEFLVTYLITFIPLLQFPRDLPTFLPTQLDCRYSP